MKALKERIVNDGDTVGTQIVKVDGFINHQIDVAFLEEMGLELSHRFDGEYIDKILTVEASGIAIACMTAQYVGYPMVVFAKKENPNTMTDDFYGTEAKSFTKGTASVLKVSKKFISKGERVLIIDDFLAHGQASLALIDIVRQAKAEVVGIGIVIEKAFQGGRKLLEEQGIRVESLAIIEKIEDGVITFKERK